jgi:hypothetical protein
MTGQHTIKRFGERERERLIKLFRSLGTLNNHEAEAARGRIDSLLREFGKSWSDLIQLLGDSGAVMTISPDLAADIIALGSPDLDERANARRRIMELLARHRMSWNDLADALCSVSSAAWLSGDSLADDLGPGAPERVKDLLGLVRHILSEYVSLRDHEYVAVALWILHTHVYDSFMVTPRLALRSATADCGKTTLLDLMARLVARPEKFDAITPAVIYRLVNETRPCLLIDEADNLGLGLRQNNRLKAIFNSGHHYPGNIWIVDSGKPRKFATFAPMSLALPDAFGNLPRTLNSRCITLMMERHDGSRKLRRLDRPDPAIDAAYGQILLWREDLQRRPLDPDPEMPAGMRNRFADNWRPLLSIADNLGYGLQARSAMTIMAREHQDADAKLLLLGDIRKVFDAAGADRLPSSVLLTALHDLDDAGWCEFGGISDEQAPHRLRYTEMAGMLRAFGIRPRSVWPLHRTAESKSSKGYTLVQFEDAWRKYCREDGTPAQGSNIKVLRRAGDGTV